MNIDVVRNVHIRMPEQLGKNLDVHALVVAVCSERMPKDMFSPVFNPCIAARALRLPSQSLVTCIKWNVNSAAGGGRRKVLFRLYL